MKKQITVLDAEQYDCGLDLFSLPLADFIHEIQKVKNTIPKEYRDSASIKISSRSIIYDQTVATIEISYWREETTEEQAQREAEDIQRVEREKQRLQAALDRLNRG